jgi:hypothetical protein
MIESRTVTVTQRLDFLPARWVVVLFADPDVGATARATQHVGQGAVQHRRSGAHIVTRRGGQRAVWLTI